MTNLITETVDCSAVYPKTTTTANAFRFEGNEAFKHHQLEESLQLYSLSLLHAIPQTRAQALALGNRSAALLDLKELEACCRDISRCFQLPVDACDEELRDKLRRRMRECESIATHERKEMRARDQQRHDPKGVQRKLMSQMAQPPTGGRNKLLPSCSATIRLVDIEGKGRGYKAVRSIPAGGLLIREVPYASLLSRQVTSLLCHHCFLPLPPDWLPCDYCSNSNYRFCTLKCRDSAWYAYHDFECAHDIDVYAEEGEEEVDEDVRLKLMLAVRLLVTATEEELREGMLEFGALKIETPIEQVESNGGKKEEQSDPLAEQVDGLEVVEEVVPEPGTRFDSSFTSFYSLYGDSDDRRLPRTFNDILRRLSRSPKFECLFDESVDELDRLAAIEKLFRRVLAKLARNMHGMLPIFQPSKHEQLSLLYNSMRPSDSSMAVGMFCQQAICNHSCVPNVTSTHVGNSVEVRAVRDIEEGEEIVQSYGPRYGESVREQRHALLMGQYKFECDCMACTDKQMNENEAALSAFVCIHCSRDSARIRFCDEIDAAQLYCVLCERTSTCDTMMRAGAAVDQILTECASETSKFDMGVKLDRLATFLPALKEHFGAHNVTYIDNVRRASHLMLGDAERVRRAAVLYDELLAHVKFYFTENSEQYESMVFEAMLAYGAAERCNEAMLAQCRTALRLVVEQSGLRNARISIAMRFGEAGADFFDDIFSAFGGLYMLARK